MPLAVKLMPPELGVEVEAEAAFVEGKTVGLGQYGDQKLRRRPVDVEIARMRARRAPFENVAPPGIEGACAHVIGHEVQDDADASGAERLDHGAKTILAAERGLDLVIAGDVVAVGRAGQRAQDRRSIKMACAELGEIGRKRACPGEIHASRGIADDKWQAPSSPGPLGGHSPGHGAKEGLFAERLDRGGDLAPPVRMLVNGAWQVRLLEGSQGVVDLDGE